MVLAPAIEKGVNHHEIGDIVRFGIEHRAVRGIAVCAHNSAGYREQVRAALMAGDMA